MNSSLGLKIIAPILVLGMSVATPMFADDTDSAPPGSASSSMHQAGESMENAATNTGHAATGVNGLILLGKIAGFCKPSRFCQINGRWGFGT
jgi:hypothetical protein